jgi:hypothetical protein
VHNLGHINEGVITDVNEAESDQHFAVAVNTWLAVISHRLLAVQLNMKKSPSVRRGISDNQRTFVGTCLLRAVSRVMRIVCAEERQSAALREGAAGV